MCAFVRIKCVNRFDESDGTDGNQIIRVLSAGVIFAYNVRYETQIPADECTAGIGITFPHRMKQLSFLFCGQRCGKGMGSGDLQKCDRRTRKQKGKDCKHGKSPLRRSLYAGVFLLLQNKKYKLKEKSANALAIVSTLSIGVYYIHMLVLTVIEKIGFAGESNPLILVGKVVVTYLVSLFGAFVISKIPFVRKVLLGVK